MFQTIQHSIANFFLFLIAILCLHSQSFAESDLVQKEHFVSLDSKQVNCRIFYQDHKTKELKWFNLYHGVPYTYSSPKTVEGFPKLDPEKQNLVGMVACKGTLLIGIKDNSSGEFQSGWVMLSTGVREVPHGNHSHWYYDQSPKVIYKKMNKEQGNIKNVYVYQDVYYLTHDRKDGFTRIDPLDIATNTSTKPAVGFHAGSGNHATLAVTKNQAGYSTWIDKEGKNKGRVDVTKISPNGNKQIAHSFNLPSGSIQGSTISNDKIVFAAEDGICWVQANSNGDATKVNQISLGTNPETKKPLRTNAFTRHQNDVLFVKGSGESAALCILNTAPQTPKLSTVSLKMEKGNSPTTPVVVKTRWNQRLAFVFHNHEEKAELDDYLSIFDLDPNGDMSSDDAVLIKTIKVGASSVQGDFGHNKIAFDHANRLAFWTNPGDGKIYALSLRTLNIITNFKVDGMPTKIHVDGERDVWAH